MKRKVINKKMTYIALIIVALILVSITWIEILREYTDWPFVRLRLSESQGEQYKRISVYDFFPEWFPSSIFYFTTWANIIIYSTMLYSFARKRTISFEWKISLMIMSFITFFVFALFIAPYLPWGQSAWFDFVYIHEHLNLFIITLIWFAFSIGKYESRKNHATISSLYIPISYLLWSIFIYGKCQGKVAIYTFLDFQRPFGFNGNEFVGIMLTTMFILFLSGIIYLLAVYLSKWNNYLYSKSEVEKIKNTL